MQKDTQPKNYKRPEEVNSEAEVLNDNRKFSGKKEEKDVGKNTAPKIENIPEAGEGIQEWGEKK